MFNRRRITSSPAQPWQEAAARDRAGEAGSSARSRPFPSSNSFHTHPSAARPPAAPNALHPFAAPLPASNPFAAPLPASNPFASRLPASNSFACLPASRPLSAPRDGTSDDASSSSSSSSSASSASSSIDAETGLKKYKWGVDEEKDESLRKYFQEGSAGTPHPEALAWIRDARRQFW